MPPDALSIFLAAAEASDSEALVCGDERWTYADLAARVAAALGELRAAGVAPGDRVAVQASNRRGLVVLFLALAEQGAALVPLHPRLTAAEVERLVADCSPRLSLDGQGVDALTAGGNGRDAGGNGRDAGGNGRKGDEGWFAGGEGGVRAGGLVTRPYKHGGGWREAPIPGKEGGLITRPDPSNRGDATDADRVDDRTIPYVGAGYQPARPHAPLAPREPPLAPLPPTRDPPVHEPPLAPLPPTRDPPIAHPLPPTREPPLAPAIPSPEPSRTPSDILTCGPDSPLAMLYTSGTTGQPKGAILTRSAFVAAAAASHENLACGPGDRWVLCLPLCHIGGLSIVTRCVAGRAAVILLPRFDAEATIEAIVREQATLLSVVPTMLRALLEADIHNRMAGLRAVLVGGAAAPAELLDECARRGVLALTTYGLTEACSQVCSQAPRDPFSRELGSGFPLPGAELRIVPLDAPSPPAAHEATTTQMDSHEAPTGQPGTAGGGGAGVWRATAEEPGRIQIRGPMMMTGYRGQAPLAGGWFDTGDLGHQDEGGRLFLHARRTDLIVSGGENVYPAEVEAALTSQPGVREALVFGVPDERWGQRVAVAIVPGGDLDLSALRRGLEGRLAGHKRPRLVCLADALPVGSTGKVLRREALSRFGHLLTPWEAPPGLRRPARWTQVEAKSAIIHTRRHHRDR